MKLTFDTGGTVSGLYGEEIDLRSLGPLAIRRATNIEFNDTTQQWEVRGIKDNQPLFAHPSRAACLQWEVENLA
mgnify:CR=1 FL=1